MDRITPTLAERIAARRKELGLRQEDLAQAAGVSTAAVSQWERGETKNLKLENFFAIADKLKVQARWLALGQGTKFAAIAILLVIPALLPLVAGLNCVLCKMRFSLANPPSDLGAVKLLSRLIELSAHIGEHLLEVLHPPVEGEFVEFLPRDAVGKDVHRRVIARSFPIPVCSEISTHLSPTLRFT